MRVKVAVKETAYYEVWLDVDNPHDHQELEIAFTNLDNALADHGMLGYDDREFTILATETAAR